MGFCTFGGLVVGAGEFFFIFHDHDELERACLLDNYIPTFLRDITTGYLFVSRISVREMIPA